MPTARFHAEARGLDGRERAFRWPWPTGRCSGWPRLTTSSPGSATVRPSAWTRRCWRPAARRAAAAAARRGRRARRRARVRRAGQAVIAGRRGAGQRGAAAHHPRGAGHPRRAGRRQSGARGGAAFGPRWRRSCGGASWAPTEPGPCWRRSPPPESALRINTLVGEPAAIADHSARRCGRPTGRAGAIGSQGLVIDGQFDVFASVADHPRGRSCRSRARRCRWLGRWRRAGPARRSRAAPGAKTTHLAARWVTRASCRRRAPSGRAASLERTLRCTSATPASGSPMRPSRRTAPLTACWSIRRAAAWARCIPAGSALEDRA